MIATEKTADRKDVVLFLQREFIKLGYGDHRMDDSVATKLTDEGTRWLTLEEDGAIVAAIGIDPYDTTKGRGYSVSYFVVAKDHSDKILVFDALVLFGANLVQSEGVKFIRTVLQQPDIGDKWGKDYSGLTRNIPLTQEPDSMAGSPQDLMRAILGRRPEWRTSLSSMPLI